MSLVSGKQSVVSGCVIWRPSYHNEFPVITDVFDAPSTIFTVSIKTSGLQTGTYLKRRNMFVVC